MGVPAFYRWISTRYPKIVRDCLEDLPHTVNGAEVPVDTSQPNPNGIEFDNLYLDMNGIIHPCFHPEDRPAPTTENEVFIAIFDYIDRLFGIVRPRKLLYMAIDGVAPRAKMNQQRSRRFRAAQDAEEREREEERLREEFAKQGIKIPIRDKGDAAVFDSNVITPGTPFMHRLSVALQYYVHLRLNADPGWKDVKVILSDANCPGEGEHKVMAYIREQRAQPAHDPNTRHCVYGLDADLIMLALSTHEPRFVILREVVFPPAGHGHKNGSQTGIEASLQSLMAAPGTNGDSQQGLSVEEETNKPEIARKPYQFLMVNVLREYLERDLGVPCPFPMDKERLYDDFVFMCFFVGNDFLPHMPTLEIREGAIDLLMTTYRRMLPTLGHLVQGAQVHLDKVERFISEIGNYEDTIFQKRMRLLRRQKDRRRQQQEQERAKQRAAQGNRSGDAAKADKKNYKWTSRAPAAEVAMKAQAVANAMSKSAKLATAVKGASMPPPGGFNVQSGKPTAGELDKAALEANPVGSNKSAAQQLRERMRGSKIAAAAADAAEETGVGAKRPGEDTSTASEDVFQKPKRAKTDGKRQNGENGEKKAGAAMRAEASPGPADRGAGAAGGSDEEEVKPVLDAGNVLVMDDEALAVKQEGDTDRGMMEVKTEVKTETEVGVVKQEQDGAEALWESMGGDKGAEPRDLHLVSEEGGQRTGNKLLDAQENHDGGDGASLDDDVALSELEEEEEEEAEEEVSELIGDADVDPEAAKRSREAVENFKNRLKDDVKEKADMFDHMVEHEERIRLGEAGWKDRYYTEKLGISDAVERGTAVRSLVQSYVEGLVWVMRYYYDGVASWTWYYPYHYAPFASDLIGLSGLDIHFELGEPFKPFDQLMGVLPAASSHALPKPYRPLFTAKDSPILDFYPTHFDVDMNGKRFAWQGVALLPFIDEQRLLTATRSKEPLLNEEESYRNSRRVESLYVAGAHPLAPDMFEVAEEAQGKDSTSKLAAARPIDPDSSQGMTGLLAAPGGDPCPAVVPAPFSNLGRDITANAVVVAAYILPEHKPHVVSLLPGAKEEDPVLSEEDVMQEPMLWHEDNRGGARRGPGNGSYYNHRQQGGYGGYGGGGAGGPPAPVGYGQYGFNAGAMRPDAAQRMLHHSMAAGGSRGGGGGGGGYSGGYGYTAIEAGGYQYQQYRGAPPPHNYDGGYPSSREYSYPSSREYSYQPGAPPPPAGGGSAPQPRWQQQQQYAAEEYAGYQYSARYVGHAASLPHHQRQQYVPFGRGGGGSGGPPGYRGGHPQPHDGRQGRGGPPAQQQQGYARGNPYSALQRDRR